MTYNVFSGTLNPTHLSYSLAVVAVVVTIVAMLQVRTTELVLAVWSWIARELPAGAAKVKAYDWCVKHQEKHLASCSSEQRSQATTSLEKHRSHYRQAAIEQVGGHTPRPFYGPFSGTTQVSLCQKRNFWTLWCKGRLTEAGTQTIRLCATPSGLTSAHLHHPTFLQA